MTLDNEALTPRPSRWIEVGCGGCGEVIGASSVSGGGARLFGAHIQFCPVYGGREGTREMTR